MQYSVDLQTAMAVDIGWGDYQTATFWVNLFLTVPVMFFLLFLAYGVFKRSLVPSVG